MDGTRIFIELDVFGELFIRFCFLINIEVLRFANLLECRLRLQTLEYQNGIFSLDKVLDGLRFLLANDEDFEFVGERQRYPISRLLLPVLVCKVLRPIQNHDNLRVFIHVFFVLFVGDFEPLPELCPQLVIKNLNSLVDLVYLADFGHDVVDKRLVFVLVVGNRLFLLLVGQLGQFGFCSSLRHFFVGTRVLDQRFQRCKGGPAVNAFDASKVRKNHVAVLVDVGVVMLYCDSGRRLHILIISLRTTVGFLLNILHGTVRAFLIVQILISYSWGIFILLVVVFHYPVDYGMCFATTFISGDDKRKIGITIESLVVDHFGGGVSILLIFFHLLNILVHLF